MKKLITSECRVSTYLYYHSNIESEVRIKLFRMLMKSDEILFPFNFDDVVFIEINPHSKNVKLDLLLMEYGEELIYDLLMSSTILFRAIYKQKKLKEQAEDVEFNEI